MANANGNKDSLKPWQPGQSGNPNGRPKLPDEIKAIRGIDTGSFYKMVCKYLEMPFCDLEVAAQDTQLPTLEMLIVRVLYESTIRGDTVRMNAILDRVLGKAPVTINVQPDHVQSAKLTNLTNQLTALLNEANSKASTPIEELK